MRRTLLVVAGAVALGGALYLGVTFVTRPAATRERRAADCSAAVSAVAAAHPRVSDGDISADFWNPTSDSIAVVQVTFSQAGSGAYNVTVRWDPTRRTSAPVSLEPVTAPK